MNNKLAQNMTHGGSDSYGNCDKNYELDDEMQTLFTSQVVKRNNASLGRLHSGSQSTTFAPTMNPTQMASFSVRLQDRDKTIMAAGAYADGVTRSFERREQQKQRRQGSHLNPKSSPSLGPESPSPHYGTMRRVSRNEDCNVLNFTAYTGQRVINSIDLTNKFVSSNDIQIIENGDFAFNGHDADNLQQSGPHNLNQLSDFKQRTQMDNTGRIQQQCAPWGCGLVMNYCNPEAQDQDQHGPYNHLKPWARPKVNAGLNMKQHQSQQLLKHASEQYFADGQVLHSNSNSISQNLGLPSGRYASKGSEILVVSQYCQGSQAQQSGSVVGGGMANIQQLYHTSNMKSQQRGQFSQGPDNLMHSLLNHDNSYKNNQTVLSEDSNSDAMEIGSNHSYQEDLDQVNPINEYPQNEIPQLSQPFEKLSSTRKSRGRTSQLGAQQKSLGGDGKYSTPFSSASVVKVEDEADCRAGDFGGAQIGNRTSKLNSQVANKYHTQHPATGTINDPGHKKLAQQIEGNFTTQHNQNVGGGAALSGRAYNNFAMMQVTAQNTTETSQLEVYEEFGQFGKTSRIDNLDKGTMGTQKSSGLQYLIAGAKDEITCLKSLNQTVEIREDEELVQADESQLESKPEDVLQTNEELYSDNEDQIKEQNFPLGQLEQSQNELSFAQMMSQVVQPIAPDNYKLALQSITKSQPPHPHVPPPQMTKIVSPSPPLKNVLISELSGSPTANHNNNSPLNNQQASVNFSLQHRTPQDLPSSQGTGVKDSQWGQASRGVPQQTRIGEGLLKPEDFQAQHQLHINKRHRRTRSIRLLIGDGSATDRTMQDQHDFPDELGDTISKLEQQRSSKSHSQGKLKTNDNLNIDKFLKIIEELIVKRNGSEVNVAELLKNLKDELVRAYKFIRLMDDKHDMQRVSTMPKNEKQYAQSLIQQVMEDLSLFRDHNFESFKDSQGQEKLLISQANTIRFLKALQSSANKQESITELVLNGSQQSGCLTDRSKNANLQPLFPNLQNALLGKINDGKGSNYGGTDKQLVQAKIRNLNRFFKILENKLRSNIESEILRLKNERADSSMNRSLNQSNQLLSIPQNQFQEEALPHKYQSVQNPDILDQSNSFKKKSFVSKLQKPTQSWRSTRRDAAPRDTDTKSHQREEQPPAAAAPVGRGRRKVRQMSMGDAMILTGHDKLTSICKKDRIKLASVDFQNQNDKVLLDFQSNKIIKYKELDNGANSPNRNDDQTQNNDLSQFNPLSLVQTGFNEGRYSFQRQNNCLRHTQHQNSSKKSAEYQSINQVSSKKQPKLISLEPEPEEKRAVSQSSSNFNRKKSQSRKSDDPAHLRFDAGENTNRSDRRLSKKSDSEHSSSQGQSWKNRSYPSVLYGQGNSAPRKRFASNFNQDLLGRASYPQQQILMIKTSVAKHQNRDGSLHRKSGSKSRSPKEQINQAVSQEYSASPITPFRKKVDVSTQNKGSSRGGSNDNRKPITPRHQVSDPATSSIGHENHAIVVIEVTLKPSLSSQLVIRKYDDVEDTVSNFCVKHVLSTRKRSKLLEVAMQQIHRYYSTQQSMQSQRSSLVTASHHPRAESSTDHLKASGEGKRTSISSYGQTAKRNAPSYQQCQFGLVHEDNKKNLISCFEEVDASEEEDSAATGGRGSLMGIEHAKIFFTNGSNSNNEIYDSSCKNTQKELPPVTEEDSCNLSPRPPYLPVQESYPKLTQIDEQNTLEEHDDFD